MKICFVSETVDFTNGSGRFASSFINGLQKNFGVQSIVLVNRGEKNLLPGTFPVLFSRGKFFRFLINPLLIAWYSRRADLIHAFDGWPYTVMVYLATRLNRKKYTESLYATYAVAPLYRRGQKFLMRAAYKNSSLNAAISNVTASRLKEAYPAVNVEAIQQGIDFDHYQNKFSDFQVPNSDYIITVATMKLRKGYHFALPVFAKLKQKFPGLKYVIIARRGKDEYSIRIDQMIRDLNLGEDIVRLEFVEEEDLIKLYKNAKAFFLPSESCQMKEYFEGFGSVYLEAQSCGAPVVTSQGGGQEDALIDGETGLLVEEGNIDGYVHALTKILSDGELYKRMSDQALVFAKSMDWKNTLTRYFDRYKEIIYK